MSFLKICHKDLFNPEGGWFYLLFRKYCLIPLNSCACFHLWLGKRVKLTASTSKLKSEVELIKMKLRQMDTFSFLRCVFGEMLHLYSGILFVCQNCFQETKRCIQIGSQCYAGPKQQVSFFFSNFSVHHKPE